MSTRTPAKSPRLNATPAVTLPEDVAGKFVSLLSEINQDAELANKVPEDALPGLIADCRRVLLPATPDQIGEEITRLGNEMKWAGENTVRSQSAFLAGMLKAVARVGFSAVIVSRAVDRMVDTEEWMPSTAEFLGACRKEHNKLDRAVWRLEHRHQQIEHDKRHNPADDLRKMEDVQGHWLVLGLGSTYQAGYATEAEADAHIDKVRQEYSSNE